MRKSSTEAFIRQSLDNENIRCTFPALTETLPNNWVNTRLRFFKVISLVAVYCIPKRASTSAILPFLIAPFDLGHRKSSWCVSRCLLLSLNLLSRDMKV